MKIEMVVSETNKRYKIVSAEGFRNLFEQKMEDYLDRLDTPVTELQKRMEETEALLDQAREDIFQLNRAADVMIKNHEIYSQRNYILPLNSVGVQVDMPIQNLKVLSQSNRHQPVMHQKLARSSSAIMPSIPFQHRGEGNTVHDVSTGCTSSVKRSIPPELLDLTGEDSRPAKQFKAFSTLDKSSVTFVGALTQKPISNKSQPLTIIRGGNPMQSKLNAVSSLPQSSPSATMSQLMSTPQPSSTSQQVKSVAPQMCVIPQRMQQPVSYLIRSDVAQTVTTNVDDRSTNALIPSAAGTRKPSNNESTFCGSGRRIAPRLPTAFKQTGIVRPTPSNVFKHPAKLPEPPRPPAQSLHIVAKPPPKPVVKATLTNASIVLSWNLELNGDHAKIKTYQIYGYEETSGPADTNLWKKVGEVKSLPLPMACTLARFAKNRHYHFAIRAMDMFHRIGYFSDTVDVHLKP